MNNNVRKVEAEVMDDKKRMTVDEKRAEKFRKLFKRISNIREEDVRELPEWKQKQIRDMLEEMVSHIMWIRRTLEEKDQRDNIGQCKNRNCDDCLISVDPPCLCRICKSRDDCEERPNFICDKFEVMEHEKEGKSE